jgi:outer membrane lipoprotein SlyB
VSEERKVVPAEEQRGLVADTVAAVVTGVSGGVAGAAVQQGLAKLSGDKDKDDKKS